MDIKKWAVENAEYTLPIIFIIVLMYVFVFNGSYTENVIKHQAEGVEREVIVKCFRSVSITDGAGITIPEPRSAILRIVKDPYSSPDEYSVEIELNKACE